ncbi:MAG: hypothetical protein IPI89_09700 [Propionivibrio sp.]|nr:hypothetical protein [Propionivibrio sp.]
MPYSQFPEDSLDLSFEDKAALKKFFILANYPRDRIDLPESLRLTSRILPYCQIADENSDIWLAWQIAFTRILSAIADFERQEKFVWRKVPSSQIRNGGRWHKKISEQPLLACLTQDVSENPQRYLPVLALVLIAFRLGEAQFSKSMLVDLANNARILCSSGGKRIDLLMKLPVATSDTDRDWPRKLLLAVRSGKSTETFEPTRSLCVSLEKVLVVLGFDQLSEILFKETRRASDPVLAQPPPTITREASSTISVRMSEPAVQEELPVRKKPIPKRPPEPKSIRIRNFPKGSDDRDTKAAEPEDLVFGQAETTPVDAPQASIGLQKQQARYTNFRTAIDNQFLPWAWNVLHDQEIQFLVAAIEAEVHKDGEHKIGAWLASLSLATGLPTRLLFDVMLNDASGDSHSIVRPDIWNRRVITPENAFIPDSHQEPLLHPVNYLVALRLPEIVAAPIKTLLEGRSDQISVGKLIDRDAGGAEAMVRDFLKTVRSTDAPRLLLGRIHSVLGRQIIRLTEDPVLTQLLTALPTDLPSAGLYYATFTHSYLRSVYRAAIEAIFESRAP